MKRNAFTKSGSCPISLHVLPSVVATIEVAQIWSAQPWLVVTHAWVASTAARFESPLARACRTNGSRAVSVHVRPPSPEEKTPAWHGGGGTRPQSSGCGGEPPTREGESGTIATSQARSASRTTHSRRETTSSGRSLRSHVRPLVVLCRM